MAAPHVTLAALTEIRRLVVNANAKKPVVYVGWEADKVDNRRGPSGANVWTRVSEGKWIVGILDYENPDLPGLKDGPTIKAYDLEFFAIVVDRYGRQVPNPSLDFQAGTFVLRDAAI